MWEIVCVHSWSDERHTRRSSRYTGTIPEPTTVLTARKSAIRVPIPRSKSPVKTNLGTPARRDPSIGADYHPVRGDIRTTPAHAERFAVRKLDFSREQGISGRSPYRHSPKKSPRPLTNGVAQRRSPAARLSFAPRQSETEEDEIPAIEDMLEDEPAQDDNDYHVVEDDGFEDAAISPDDESSEHVEVITQSPARMRKSPIASKTGLGRPPKRKRYAENDIAGHVAAEPKTKPGKTVDPRSQPRTVNGGRAQKTKKPRDSLVVASSPQVIVQQPRRPRRHNGLFSLRHEMPHDSTVRQTRAGRTVIKPLQYWKGEEVEHDFEEIFDGKDTVFLPRIKSVIRAEEVLETTSRRVRNHPSKSKAKRIKAETNDDQDEPDESIEAWELEPGRVCGDVRKWNPDDPIGLESPEEEAELALSSAAIITRDIKDSSFKFAKTLTLPFFGSGVVDLPPGAVKKPKNSRRMQMVFFVFSGRVSVTVNENTFRIGRGGMWQVPRGMVCLAAPHSCC